MADTKVVSVTIALPEVLYDDLEVIEMVSEIDVASLIKGAIKKYAEDWCEIKNEFEDGDTVELEVELPEELCDDLKIIELVSQVKVGRLIEDAVKSYVADWYDTSEK